jgi:excinuclease ABC subunit A
MGPEGGSGGGTVVAEGTPEHVAAQPDSHTGIYLKRLLHVSKTSSELHTGPSQLKP